MSAPVINLDDRRSQATVPRPLPANVEAEQAVLGCVLLNNAVWHAIGPSLEPTHFSEVIHQQIYEVASGLIRDGKAATPITVKTFLAEGEIPGSGMTLHQYMARLVMDACAPLNTPDYARIVVDMAARRDLIKAATDLQALAYDAPVGLAVERIVDGAEERLMDVRARFLASATPTRFTGGDAAADLLDHIDRIRAGERQGTGVTTGIPDLDFDTGGMRGGDLWIVAGRVAMGKSILATALARAAAKSGAGTLLFPFEIGRRQAVARVLADLSYSSRKPVGYGAILKGDVDDEARWHLDDAWQRLKAMPLVIDDLSGATLAQVGARVRAERDRMTKRGVKLGVVILDYLKFIKATDRYAGQRHYEVGEISVGLKRLAKDMDVCVVLLAQVNRGTEAREDKRPQLADLRECVVGSTLLTDAVTGHRVSIRDAKPGQNIFAMDDKQRLRAFTIHSVWSTGIKPTFRLRTRTGREIVATANHPLFTPSGWRRVDELAVGSEIATAMRLPEHGSQSCTSPDLCRFLGYMVGDGTYQKHRSVGFISSDPDTFVDVCRIVAANFPGVTATIKAKKGGWQEADFVCTDDNGFGRPYGNPARQWIRAIGIFGQKDSTKRVPLCAFETQSNAANFIAGYLSSDGCVKCATKGKRELVWEIHFDSVSRDLLLDVQALLTRFGIVGCINDGYLSKKGTMPIYRLNVSPSADNLARFADAVPAVGRKGALLAKMRTTLAPTRTSADLFALPAIISKLVGILAPRQCLGARNGPKTYSGWNDIGKRMRRDVCEKWADELCNDDLRMWASSDLLWERVASIEPSGDQEVFDISVPGAENFLANGIVAHNSGDLESDADVVAFVYRDAYYIDRSAAFTRGDPDATARSIDAQNKLELIVGKNRTGAARTHHLWCDVACSTIAAQARGGLR